MSSRSVAFDNEILRGVVGSTAHGTGIDGEEDRDEMGIFIEPPSYVCGLKPLDHYIQRDRPPGIRSQPGDLDLTLYSLRKFCRLAVDGNPSILLLLWLPDYIVGSTIGMELVGLRTAFISKNAGKRFLGYLRSQRMRLTGEKSATVSRPELVTRYGYDTKFAMHALRLGMQGIELLTTGNLSVPIRDPDLSTLRAIRRGQIKYDDVISMIMTVESALEQQIDQCSARVPVESVESFLIWAHRDHWGWAS